MEGIPYSKPPITFTVPPTQLEDPHKKKGSGFESTQREFERP